MVQIWLELVVKFLEKEMYKEFAILDVETTGGKFNEEKITEIAIIVYDGDKIIDKFETLINPGKDIQPFVQKLTGINMNLVKNSPKFKDVSEKIFKITKDKIIVAHNVDFDYRVIKNEFQSKGLKSAIWNAKDMNGNPVSAGMYFFSLNFENFNRTQKVLFIK